MTGASSAGGCSPAASAGAARPETSHSRVAHAGGTSRSQPISSGSSFGSPFPLPHSRKRRGERVQAGYESERRSQRTRGCVPRFPLSPLLFPLPCPSLPARLPSASAAADAQRVPGSPAGSVGTRQGRSPGSGKAANAVSRAHSAQAARPRDAPCHRRYLGPLAPPPAATWPAPPLPAPRPRPLQERGARVEPAKSERMGYMCARIREDR